MIDFIRHAQQTNVHRGLLFSSGLCWRATKQVIYSHNVLSINM